MGWIVLVVSWDNIVVMRLEGWFPARKLPMGWVGLFVLGADGAGKRTGADWRPSETVEEAHQESIHGKADDRTGEESTSWHGG